MTRFRQVSSHTRPAAFVVRGLPALSGQTQAGFGDRRSYMYQNKEVDQQTHLGEDLASLVHSPVPTANNGVVVLAEPLGIYGNTVILDHGLGVFSSYSHLSQIDVKVGDKLAKGAVVGKTGTTGLAGGDHLHFAINLQGEFVDPVEWWDAHWLKDQVEAVWVKAGAPAPEAAPAAAKPKKGHGKKKAAKAGRTRSKAKKKTGN